MQEMNQNLRLAFYVANQKQAFVILIQFHKRKTVTDLEQRVVERKKKYVRYQEGAELYSMGINTFREIARDAKATVRIKGIVLVNIEIFEEYLELFKEGF